MDEDTDRPSIKITDRRHFDRSGEKRPDAEVAPSSSGALPEGTATSTLDGAQAGQAGPRKSPAEPPPATAGARNEPEPKPPTARSDPRDARSRPPREDPPGPSLDPGNAGPAGDLMDVASRLSSSFSLLVARLAQETEIYLGLVPFPGKETAEPDFEAARAMIDMLSMLQEKTRGNLDPEESQLLENLLYTYRLEFVRRRSGGGVR